MAAVVKTILAICIVWVYLWLCSEFDILNAKPWHARTTSFLIVCLEIHFADKWSVLLYRVLSVSLLISCGSVAFLYSTFRFHWQHWNSEDFFLKLSWACQETLWCQHYKAINSGMKDIAYVLQKSAYLCIQLKWNSLWGTVNICDSAPAGILQKT